MHRKSRRQKTEGRVIVSAYCLLPFLCIREGVCCVIGMEGFEAFGASVTDATGGADAFITGVGMLVGDVEFEAKCYDFGFPFVDKRRVDIHVGLTGGPQ